MVGSCSFAGQPKDGKVEIAYWTFKEFEEQSIASFACKYCMPDRPKSDHYGKHSTRTQRFYKNFREQPFCIYRKWAGQRNWERLA